MKKEAVVYPSPPDTARIQFLTSISSSENTVEKRSGFAKYILGEELPRPIKKPYGIAVRKGKICICDTGLGGLEIIDLEKSTFEYFIPKGMGQLQLPINCFVGEEGTLYVADANRKQVVLFDEKGNYLDSFGEPENFKPTDVFVDSSRIYVANLKHNEVSVYDRDSLRLLYSFPDSMPGKEEHLYSPTNLYVRNDTVYVSDMGDFRVKLFTSDGKYLGAVGSLGANPGHLVRPKGIAVDRESNLYVVDAGIENTQIFNRDGKLLLFFGGPYNTKGDMWLPAKVTIDYDNLKYFQKYVDPAYTLKYLVFITNQYGPDKINVYGRISPRINGQK